MACLLDFEYTTKIDDEEVTFDVEFSLTTGLPGFREKKTNLPLSPDDEDEIEVIKITDCEGEDVTESIKQSHGNKIIEAAWEYLEKQKNSW